MIVIDGFIRAKFQGAGCAKLTYTWKVALDVNTTNDTVQNDLTAVQAKLDKIDGGLVELTDTDVCYKHV